MKPSSIFASIVVVALLVTTISAVVAMKRVHLTATHDEIPIAEVKRGDVDLQVHATGELRANHSMMLTAPAVGGDALQITRLARTGELVKKGDIVVEFDPSEQHFKLEQSHSELLQAEQEITKANAESAVLAAEDKVALLKARYNVRRAELDVQKNELVSKIDADKNQLALQQAKRVLAELEKDIESHKASGQASVYLAQEKYNKAKLAMDQAQQNLEKMRVAAPMNGLVSIQKNMDASGGFFFTGMTLPDYHPGDQAQSGSAIAQILDPQGMDLNSQVSEQQRSNVKPGEEADVDFDALPGNVFRGTVKNVSGMSMPQFFDSSASRGFDVSIQLAREDVRLRSGFTAHILFRGGTQKNVLYVPRQALFLKDGKRIVYVKRASGYEQREVKIQCASESRAVIEGLDAGTEVALVDPTAPRKTSGGSSTAGSQGAP